MRPYTLALCALATAVLAGCGEDPVSASQPAAAPLAGSVTVRLGTPSGAPSRRALPTESEAFASLQTTIALHRAVLKSASWEEADREIRALLADGSLPGLSYQREQEAAALMLRTQLLDAAPSEAQREAVAFYTDLLLKNNSPEAPVIERALRALEGHWSEERIEEAAATAAAAARSALEAQACATCPAARVTTALEAGGVDMDGRAVQAEAAVQALETMAQQ